MNIEYIKRYLGIPVIVQLREAIAIGHAGAVRAAPVPNATGEPLLKDGTVAPADAKREDMAVRPVWPIEVRQDDDKSPQFRFAIANAMVSVRSEEPDIVLIHYEDERRTMYELAVTLESIVGITCVRAGETPKPESRLICPPN